MAVFIFVIIVFYSSISGGFKKKKIFKYKKYFFYIIYPEGIFSNLFTNKYDACHKYTYVK